MKKQSEQIEYEGACDLYYILNVLKVNMCKKKKAGGKQLQASQEDVIYKLFYSCTDMETGEPIQYHPATISRWFSGKAQISQNVSEYYAANADKLTADFQYQVIPAMPEPETAVNALVQAYCCDDYISEEEKLKFRETFLSRDKAAASQRTAAGYAEWNAKIMAHILLSAMKTQYPSRDPKTQRLNRPTNPIDRLIHYVPKPCEPFLGREKELAQLDDLLEEKKHVFLHGLPGYGKSELAKAYAHHPQFRQKYNAVVYIPYSGSLKVDIANLLFMGENRPSGSSTVNLSAIITPPKNANTQVDYEFETHMRYLRGLSEKYLIIIDNFDALPYAIAQSPERPEEETVPFQNDPQISNVLQLPCRLLFCTRCNPGFWEPAYASRCLELKALETKTLTQLVTHFFPQAPSYKKEVSGMIRALEGNTLLIKLAAILFHTSAMEPAQILQKLEEENLAMGVSDSIGAEIKGNYRRDSFAVHARALFRLYLLSESHQDVLRNMALMPLSGVGFRRFCSWLKLENADSINDLLSMGLLSKDQKGKIFLHPLIQQAAKEETRPSVENCRVLLDSFSQICLEYIGINKTKIPDELNAICSITTQIREEGSRESAEKYAIFLENAIPYLYQHARFAQADELVAHTDAFLKRTQVGDQVDCIVMEVFELLREDKPVEAISLLQNSVNSSKIPLFRELRKLLFEGIKQYLFSVGKNPPPLRMFVQKNLSSMGDSRWLRIFLYGISMKLERIQESDRLLLKLELAQQEDSERSALPQPEVSVSQEK